MKAKLRISEAADQLGVCTKTLRRWETRGQIICSRTIGGHRRFSHQEVIRVMQGGIELTKSHKKIAVYARVSSHDQKRKGDLQRQINVGIKHAKIQWADQPVVYSDVASGLHITKRGLHRLCQEVEKRRIVTVIVTYPDRLTRFGLIYLKRYFASHGTNLIIINAPKKHSMHEELVQDLVALVTSFSGRLYGMRSHKNRLKSPKAS